MVDDFIFEKLVVLNSAYNNTLAPAPAEFIQSDTIKTELFSHQKMTVQGMSKFRDRMTHGFMHNNQAINGKIGILADAPSSGKTLSVLAYLSHHYAGYPRIASELVANSSRYFYSHELYEVNDASYANLIIVPPHLFNNWRKEIDKHTSLQYIAIETKRHINGDNLAQNIINSTFVLTTSKCYKNVQEFVDQNNIKWNNIFIDEASSIYISPNDPSLKFQFLWLIASNWIPLLFKNAVISKTDLYYLKDRVKLNSELENWLLAGNMTPYEGHLSSAGFLKNYLPQYHQYRSLLIIRNNSDTINSSVKLLPTNEETIKCKPTTTLVSLLNMFRSYNRIPEFDTHVIPTIFQALSVQFRTTEEYIASQPIVRHALIRRRIEENECSICLDKAEYFTIVNCCHNVCCGKCVLKNAVLTQKCPTCREHLKPQNMCCINYDAHISHTQMSKLDALTNIIKENTSGKFIVYTTFDNIYYQVYNELEKIGVIAEKLESNLHSFTKTIKNYTDGNTNILFVSNPELIRGLSLHITSHLIFFHEPPSYESRQVLLYSSQQIGRKEALKIIRLNSELPI